MQEIIMNIMLTICAIGLAMIFVAVTITLVCIAHEEISDWWRDRKR